MATASLLALHQERVRQTGWLPGTKDGMALRTSQRISWDTCKVAVDTVGRVDVAKLSLIGLLCILRAAVDTAIGPNRELDEEIAKELPSTLRRFGERWAANGALGSLLVPALVKAGFKVTCITRPESKPAVYEGAVAKTANYTDENSLVAAFDGQDALIEAFNPAAAAHQSLIVQAALEAGVKHIITPDFSSDTFHPRAGEVLVFEPKIVAQRELERIVAASGDSLSWTAIVIGPWYDWGIEQGMLWINKSSRTITRFGSGNQKLSMSRVGLAAEATIAVLKDPQSFANRPAYFASHTLSTNQLIKYTQEAAPGDWTIDDASVEELRATGRKLWDEDTANGVTNRLSSRAYPMLATAALFDENNSYGADFGSKLEDGWDEGDAALKENLKRLLA
ncbi:oxidoreductase [Fusarium albosuccineum]|uniref:Oxidoreductase n=1 Tax=Fusarium albosuccineum TaxID=1237068 RepID=A0A8H4P4L4_9HYPO|nr:oxidoreductase [Fusarium albosuccineum]